MVPFGIRFATDVCNRIINTILEEFSSFVDSFVDDLVVFSNSFEDHVTHLNIVLNKLQNSGVTFNKNKCVFECKTIIFLAFVVGQGEISPDVSKVNAVR